MRNFLRLFVLALVSVLGALLVTTPASARAPSCGITWGSQLKDGVGYSSFGDYVRNVRAGRHACYDRLVIELGQASGFHNFSVRYVPAVHEEGSGRRVPLRGAADLQVVVQAPAYDVNGRPTYTPRNRAELVNVSGYRTFRQVAWAGSFEGQTTFGLGTRARLPMRAFVIEGPGHDMRLVVDVAHRW